MSLITGLHQEINQLKTQNLGVTMSGGYSEEENVDNQELDEDSESGSETEEEESDTDTKAKVTSSFLNHPYSELIPTTEFTQVEVNESSESEDDEEPIVKVVDIGEIEELTVEENPSPSQNIEESDESDESDESEETNPIDYSKMQVTALKKLASEKQLASNVSKMRKQELVELLQAN